MRSLNATNFEQGNVEYIQLWVLTLLWEQENISDNIGKVYFNLGEISEDVLKMVETI
jgi:cell surface protein SprA